MIWRPMRSSRCRASRRFWLNAQLRKAYDLNSLEKIDEAKALLKDLIVAYPDDMRPYYTLGNLLRGNKEYAEAVTYYTKAIETARPGG